MTLPSPATLWRDSLRDEPGAQSTSSGSVAAAFIGTNTTAIMPQRSAAQVDVWSYLTATSSPRQVPVMTACWLDGSGKQRLSCSHADWL